MTPANILLIVALVCFLLSAVGVGLGRLNLIGAGLACCVGAVLLGSTVLPG